MQDDLYWRFCWSSDMARRYPPGGFPNIDEGVRHSEIVLPLPS